MNKKLSPPIAKLKAACAPATSRNRFLFRILTLPGIVAAALHFSAATVVAQKTVYGVSTTQKTAVVVAPAPKPPVVVVAPAPKPAVVVVAPPPKPPVVVVAPAPATVVVLPAGYIAVLPVGYTVVVIGGTRYFLAGGVHYRAEFYQGRTVYVKVKI